MHTPCTVTPQGHVTVTASCHDRAISLHYGLDCSSCYMTEQHGEGGISQDPEAIYLAVAPKPLSSHQHSLLPALLPLGVEHPGDAGREEQGAAVHTSAYLNSHLQAANPRSGKMQSLKVLPGQELFSSRDVLKRFLTLQVVHLVDARAAGKHLHF